MVNTMLPGVTVVDAEAAGEPFRARGVVQIDAGWAALYGGELADDKDKEAEPAHHQTCVTR